MGFLYILGALLLFIFFGTLVGALRLRRIRRQRQGKGFSRADFVEYFRHLEIPAHIPAEVYDYYVGQKAWKDFPFSPDDKYSEVLCDDPIDMENDVRALVERLGMLFLPEYILRQRGDQPIETLRDMVLWLDWVRQHQPTAATSARHGK